MKPSPLPPHALDVAGVLNPAEFQAGTDLWDATCRAGGPSLTDCLLHPDSTTRLTGVTFPVMQVVELVSAVGVLGIRARFVVLPDDKQQPRFSVALFAVGANDVVLSSYYLAERYWQSEEAPRSSIPPQRSRLARDVPKHALPVVLAGYWLANWNEVPNRYPTSPALFTSAGQPMHGYNFALSDFMDPLRGLNEYKDQVLAMNFGLHTFLNFNGKVDAPVATFGVMLQIANPSPRDEAGAGNEVFDVAIPCPPGP
jgi:hypothetical protein